MFPKNAENQRKGTRENGKMVKNKHETNIFFWDENKMRTQRKKQGDKEEKIQKGRNEKEKKDS